MKKENNFKLTKENKYERDFFISKFKKYVDLSNSNLLEIGVGNGRFGFLLGKEVKNYFGIDIDKEYVKIAKINIPKNAKVFYKVGNAEKIPFKKKFDIIFYPLSWHFIRNFRKALEEAKRVLNKNGIVAILEPSKKVKKWASPLLNKDSPEFNKILYERKLNDLRRGREAILKQNFFEVLEDEYYPKTKLNFYVLKHD